MSEHFAIPDLPTTPITNMVAVAAGSSPLWLTDLSTVAASWLPILGCAWLIMQAALKLWSLWKNRKTPT